MTISPSESPFITRAMIDFWFARLSIIGYVRSFVRAFRKPAFAPISRRGYGLAAPSH